MQTTFLVHHRLAIFRLVTVLSVLPMLTAIPVSGAAVQTDDGPRLVVVVLALNVRSGPGVSYPATGYLNQGDEVVVVGRHTDSGWWQVRLADDDTGWVSGGSAYVRITGDTSSVPAVAAPDVDDSSVTHPIRTGIIAFQTASGGPIYLVNEDGSDLRYLTDGIDPALSPDGRQLAFTRWDDRQHGAFGSVWVINVDGTGERAILGQVRQPKSPTWLSAGPAGAVGTQLIISVQEGGRLEKESKCVGYDGANFPSLPPNAYNIKVKVKNSGELEVCFDLPPNPKWGLRLVDVTTGDFEDLPRDSYSFSPTWDPINEWRVVYKGDVGLVGLDLNQKTTWLVTDDVHDHAPVFSPDGSKIAVSYWQHDHWEIHVLHADGSGRARLTETPLTELVAQRVGGQELRSWNNAAPVWSPDGSKIAFVTDRNGQWELWVMPAPGAQAPWPDGSDQRPLFPPGTLDELTFQFDGVGERMISWR